ncbi:MAG: pentapeptide repeat-containing protein [Chlorobium sp.]
MALHSFSIDKLDNLKKDSSFDNDKEFSEWFNSIVKLKIENNEYCDLQKIDLSSVNASDAYWANIDFTLADFHKAILRIASFRNSILIDARFREADLQNAVFVNAFCRKANFMLADLRYTDFSGAKLSGALFDRAKVFGVIISSQTVFADNPDKEVDNSENGDGSEMIFFKDWLSLKINEFEKPS